MRRRWLLLGLCACGDPPRPVEYARYQPEVASESWCRLDAGVFAFVPQPQVSPPLVSDGCKARRRPPLPIPARATRMGSTFAELVVEPGGAIEIPVQLPEALQGAGCRIDSVLIPHGKRVSDLAIEIASAGRVVPIVSYAQLPPPAEESESRRAVVSDGSGRPRAIWALDAPPEESSLEVHADPELWPTGAVLRFDGTRTADGTARVTFEVEPEPEPAPPPAESAATPEDPSSSSLAPIFGPSPSPDADADAQAEPAPPDADESPATPPNRQRASLALVAYRHRIGLAAPDSFSIVLRARSLAFGIGVRSDRETPDPRLSYHAPGAADPMPAHLVPQVGIVLSYCGRPVEEVLRDIR